MKNKYFLFILFFSLAFGFDLGTKMWARHRLAPKPLSAHAETITVIQGYFDFHYSANPNGVFGIFSGYSWFPFLFYPTALLCLAMILIWLAKLPKDAPWTSLKLGLLAGGAIGNVSDRLTHPEGVTDFISWHLPKPVHVPLFDRTIQTWPTFNIADVALVIGVILLILNFPKDKSLEVALAKKSK